MVHPPRIKFQNDCPIESVNERNVEQFRIEDTVKEEYVFLRPHKNVRK